MGELTAWAIVSAIAPLLVALLDRYAIAFTRMPAEPLPPYGFEITEQQTKKVEAISAEAKRSAELFVAHGIRFPDHFRGLCLAGNASQRNLRHTIGRLSEGTTELMVHPGSPNPDGDPFDRDPQRQTELNMLLNPEVPSELAERKIALVSFADLY